MGISRRTFIAAAACSPAVPGFRGTQAIPDQTGSQRLSLEQLRKWETLGYGMFLHFGMSTFVGNELPDGSHSPALYAPEKLDVGQWISVARDAGMKYAVLTAKHVAGHCLWPTAHTPYSIKSGGDHTDVVGELVKACQMRGVLPGIYYCSWDNHNRFGSKTPSDGVWNGMNGFPRDQVPAKESPPYTTSLYQTFQTAQISELLSQYGPIAEIWIDIPGVLGPGYRTFLYNHISRLQPDTVIMMNSGIGSGEDYDVDYAWPSDLIAIERRLPPEAGHEKWRTIGGKRYYIPGEACDPIGKNWFFVEGDRSRTDQALSEQFLALRARGVSFLLDVPPDKTGVIPDMYIQSLMRLRKNVGL
jgi:alpha-L-fucosidase